METEKERMRSLGCTFPCYAIALIPVQLVIQLPQLADASLQYRTGGYSFAKRGQRRCAALHHMRLSRRDCGREKWDRLDG